MSTLLRAQFIFIVVLTAAALYVAVPFPNKRLPFQVRPGIDLAGGADLRYKLLYDSKFTGDRQAAAREAADVVRRRDEARGLKEPKVTSRGDDEIVIQMAGIDAEGLRELRRLIEKTGNLELYAAVADGVTEARPGTKWVGQGTQMLVEQTPILVGRNIIAADAFQGGDLRWVTAFELDADGARRFDEAAARLYDRNPRGRIVIVLDGRIQSAPSVNSPAFHGRGQISGRSSP